MEKEPTSTTMRIQERPREGVVLGIYQTVAARRMAYDSLLWQMPALSLTAQAFLFSTVLTPGSSRTAQVIASTLALSVSLASLHALRRFRLGQHMDSLLLDRVESELGAEGLFGINPHASVESRARDLRQGFGAIMRRSPAKTWYIVLSLFALAAVVLLVGAAVGWEFTKVD